MTAPSPQRAASAEELEAPVVHGFAINPPGGPDIFVEGNNRFCHEHEFLAYRKHALDRITAAEARAEEAERERDELKLASRANVSVARRNARDLAAAEADLIALARMYGEVCRNYARFRVDADEMWDSCKRTGASMLSYKAARNRLADEVALLRGALKPFAAVQHRSVENSATDDSGLFVDYVVEDDEADFTVGDLRAARRALTVTGGTTDGQA